MLKGMMTKFQKERMKRGDEFLKMSAVRKFYAQMALNAGLDEQLVGLVNFLVFKMGSIIAIYSFRLTAFLILK